MQRSNRTMYIGTENENFIPKNFAVFNFYGEDTFFAWNADALVVFPFTEGNCTPVTRFLSAPTAISNIQCFSGRVFIICKPAGIYKLSKNYEFAVLSRTGIGIGSTFYEVLTPKNQCLYLEDKMEKNCKFLFRLSSELSNPDELCVCALNTVNTDEAFRKVLLEENDSANNLCIIANKKSVFKMSKESVRLIYSCDYLIVDIVVLQKAERGIGVLLVTDANLIVLMYAKNDRLMLEKIHFDTKVQTLCAGMNEHLESMIWIVHSDGTRTYYTKKVLDSDLVQRIGTEDQNFICLRSYKSKIILGLTIDRQVCKLPVDLLEKMQDTKKEDFLDLKYDMLKGSELTIDAICVKAREFQSLAQKLQMEQNKLRRINTFAYEQRVAIIPKVHVQKILDQIFLTADFETTLPENCQIVLALKSRKQKIFLTKLIQEHETTVEMPVPRENVTNLVDITIDLVTLTNEGSSWCLIKNYVKNLLPSEKDKGHMGTDKINFINAKLIVLRSLMAEKKLNMEKLSAIKRSVRQAIQNT